MDGVDLIPSLDIGTDTTESANQIKINLEENRIAYVLYGGGWWTEWDRGELAVGLGGGWS